MLELFNYTLNNMSLIFRNKGKCKDFLHFHNINKPRKLIGIIFHGLLDTSQKSVLRSLFIKYFS